MKIVIPGGSGQVGTILARAFHHGGHDVVVLSRNLSAVRGESSRGMARLLTVGSARLTGAMW